MISRAVSISVQARFLVRSTKLPANLVHIFVSLFLGFLQPQCSFYFTLLNSCGACCFGDGINGAFHSLQLKHRTSVQLIVDTLSSATCSSCCSSVMQCTASSPQSWPNGPLSTLASSSSSSLSTQPSPSASALSQAVLDTAYKSITNTNYPHIQRKWLVDSFDEDDLENNVGDTHRERHMTNSSDHNKSTEHCSEDNQELANGHIKHSKHNSSLGTLRRIRISLRGLSRPRTAMNITKNLHPFIPEENTNEFQNTQIPQKPMKIIRKNRQQYTPLVPLLSPPNNSNSFSRSVSLSSCSSAALNDINFQRAVLSA
ncbi:hypothetical protein BDF19DRAFT_430107 [Syncephalis fuscata]|nr:hypothetical protein BDF19DRAFT_430107 [Syncephalis fuscata]